MSQICPQLSLIGVHTHTRHQGSHWCDNPDKKLEKNLDSPIINLLSLIMGFNMGGPNFSLIFCQHYHTSGFVGIMYEHANQVQAVVGPF